MLSQTPDCGMMAFWSLQDNDSGTVHNDGELVAGLYAESLPGLAGNYDLIFCG